MDQIRDALRQVEDLKRKLYADLKAERNQQRRDEIAALLAEEKAASERLRAAYDEIRSEYENAQRRLAAQREIREKDGVPPKVDPLLMRVGGVFSGC